MPRCVFISHVAEEVAAAAQIKELLAKKLGLKDSEIFVSSRDIPLGDKWQAQVEHAIDNAAVILVLCSPTSKSQPWLYFESGFGWGRKRQVIPVCHDGLTIDDLGMPLGGFQWYYLGRRRERSAARPTCRRGTRHTAYLSAFRKSA